MTNTPALSKKDQLIAFFKRRSNLFVLEIIGVYLVWKILHYFLKHSTGLLGKLWLSFVAYLGTIYASVGSYLLNVMGEQTFSKGIVIYYPKTNNWISIEDHCLAIPATIIFISLILLFPGKRTDKLWFIPLGITFIIIINIIRILFVCQTFVYHSRVYYEINHSIVYVALTYSLILVLTIWWMRRFAPPAVKP